MVNYLVVDVDDWLKVF